MKAKINHIAVIRWYCGGRYASGIRSYPRNSKLLETICGFTIKPTEMARFENYVSAIQVAKHQQEVCDEAPGESKLGRELK